MSYEKELDFAKQLALDAGEIMQRYFRSETIDVRQKEDNTPVTVADIAVNRMVIERVRAAFPDHGILGEEESYGQERDMIWVVDPIDGTIPFTLGMPLSTFMAALVHKSDGQPVVSVVYDPYLKHLYSAVAGEGAFLNDKPLKVPASAELDGSYVTLYGNTINTDTLNYVPGILIEKLRPLGTRVINISSGGYTATKIATGEFVLLAMGNGKPWDSAAPALIVQEAGGIATDFNGVQRRYDETGDGVILAANQSVLEKFIGLIKV